MFGRKGTQAPDGPEGGLESLVAPGGKIDRAMQSAIALFSETLAAGGYDPGGLAIAGPPAPDTARLVADCITYRGQQGPEYVTLGVTRDFKAFSYQQHCYLFLIVNAVGIAESLPDIEHRAAIAATQCREPLFHAHAMRRWVRYILPVGAALGANDTNALGGCMKAVCEDIADIVRTAPDWMKRDVDLIRFAKEWTEGFPATIGRPLDSEVRRMNGIPMPEFVENILIQWLARIQADGLRQQRTAG